MGQKRIAIVNDLSGLGRCSITVALPILSAMKISCGVIPTAILSNQTEYPKYTLYDFTPHMREYIQTWRELSFQFDGIYTGFLGSEQQIEIISEIIDTFSLAKIIVDPVMGDHGQIYASYTEAMCSAMKKLVNKATLITPNLTELCILTDTPYRPDMSEDMIRKMCGKLQENGINNIIVTGIEHDDVIGNALVRGDEFEILYNRKISPVRPGTGDVFASILAGFHLGDRDIREGVTTASQFICTCLESATEMNIPINDGICFEEHLNLLI